MKKTLFTTLFFLLIISCKKEKIAALQISSQENFSLQQQNKYLNTVKKYLIDSISAIDFNNIDFSKSIATKFDSGRIYVLRLQFKKQGSGFILLKTDSSGYWSKGMVLNIKYAVGIKQNELTKKPHLFSGEMIVNSLDRKRNSDIKIHNGFRNDSGTVNNFSLPEGNYLPDVTVTAYIPSSGTGISYADWYNLLDLFTPYDLGITNYGQGGGGGGGSTFYGYYSATDPYAYGYQNSGGVQTADPKEIEYEFPESLSGISIVDYMRCLDNIKDDGAKCSIEIFSDLPINGEPNTFFNWQDGSPGHTFLQIKKSNGGQSVQQNIGFYPDQGWKTVLYTPVTGKLIDNAGHKFNASLKMDLTPDQLHTVIKEAEDLSGANYDIDENNCTDFALKVFNAARPGNELRIPLYVIPGNTGTMQSKTPQGLYQELMIMAEDGVSEAENITFPGVCGFVGGSNGPCK